jgi:hypothetical protein
MLTLDNWQFVDRLITTGYPEQEIICNHLFTKSIIRVITAYDPVYEGQRKWHQAGFLQQVSDLIYKAEINTFDVPLNQEKLFFNLTANVDSYALIFRPRNYLPNLTISIFEGLNEPMPVITNPVARAANSRSTDKPVANQSAIVAAPDLSRVGGTIFNYSKIATMFVDFSDEAKFTSPHVLKPGGQVDIPISWIGNIAAVWDKPDATGKAVIYELLT